MAVHIVATVCSDVALMNNDPRLQRVRFLGTPATKNTPCCNVLQWGVTKDNIASFYRTRLFTTPQNRV